MTQIPPIPPTVPSSLSPQPELRMPASWPKVIGIFSIVWGSLAVCCGVCGLASTALQSFAMSMMPQQQQGGAQQIPPMPDVMKPTPIELGTYVIGLGIGILLIVAGSTLVSRKSVGRPLHMAYAVASIVMTLVGGALGFMKQNAIAEWAKQNPDNYWAKMGSGGALGMAIAGVIVLLSLIYPVFILIWFGAVKRDTTEITEGFDQEPTF